MGASGIKWIKELAVLNVLLNFGYIVVILALFSPIVSPLGKAFEKCFKGTIHKYLRNVSDVAHYLLGFIGHILYHTSLENLDLVEDLEVFNYYQTQGRLIYRAHSLI